MGHAEEFPQPGVKELYEAARVFREHGPGPGPVFGVPHVLPDDNWLHIYYSATKALVTTPPEPGKLRPLAALPYLDSRLEATRGKDYSTKAPQLLLYAHEVLAVAPLVVGWPEPNESPFFAWLEIVRPMVAKGHIVFVKHPDVGFIGDGPMSVDQNRTGHLLRLMLDCPGLFHPTFRSLAEVVEVAGVLRRLPPPLDRRQYNLGILANLGLPNLRLSLDDLIRVRESEAAFAEWRSALGLGLFQVEQLASGPHWQTTARAIVADELRPYADRVGRAVQRSRFLSASVTGVRGFGLGALGATVGAAVGGDPTTAVEGGIAGAGTSALLGAAIDALIAKRLSRTDRAVLQLITLFSEDP